MRRARRSQSAVYFVLHLFRLRPLAQTRVHHTWTLMKKQALLRVSTKSLGGCSLWKLQTSCAMFLFYQWSSMFGASSTEWLEIPPSQRCPLRCARWIAEFVCAVSPHARPIRNPLVLEQRAAVLGARIYRSGHTLGRKQERGSGGWVRWSVYCVHADGVHVELAEVFAALCNKTQILSSSLSIPGLSDVLGLSDIETLMVFGLLDRSQGSAPRGDLLSTRLSTA